jgi:hypothetical protein
MLPCKLVTVHLELRAERKTQQMDFWSEKMSNLIRRGYQQGSISSKHVEIRRQFSFISPQLVRPRQQVPLWTVNGCHDNGVSC